MQENNLAILALKKLDLLDSRKVSIKYSKKFKNFNANVRYSNKEIIFSLSDKWKDFSQDLIIGLIQSLAAKIFRVKLNTFEMDLYEKFLNNLNKYNKVSKTDIILEESFNKINKKYFNLDMQKPNLVWGNKAFNKLGHYEHQTNTVLVSSIFKKNRDLLDFIMFHELLHKKHGIRKVNTRYIHHSKEFRLEEKTYEDKDIELKLKRFVRKEKIKNFLGF